jgi:hypothetical protein
MNVMSPPVRHLLRRLSRRLALGLFLDVWPAWAAGCLFVAGTWAIVCRLFFASFAPALPWLWLAPVLAAGPALAVCARRAYSHSHLVAIADTLSGGSGALLTMAERHDVDHVAWAESPLFMKASQIVLPRLRPWKRLALVAPALAFLAAALALPQRTASTRGTLGDEVVAGLEAVVAQLKQQALVTPEEERSLDEEIARIKRAALERMDASTWEAADAMRDRMAASMAAKDDAATWAEESLARYAEAAQAGAVDRSGAGSSEPNATELSEALKTLLNSGLLAGAPTELLELASGSRGLPSDAQGLATLGQSLAEFLGQRRARLGELRRSGQLARTFDPAEFSPEGGVAADNGVPGRGGINRGRADAALMWGDESQAIDRFKPMPLPPGAMRSPDDLSPIFTLPGAPKAAPVASSPSVARTYDQTPGQAAWRRTLAPRHRSAVKKYFDSEPK